MHSSGSYGRHLLAFQHAHGFHQGERSPGTDRPHATRDEAAPALPKSDPRLVNYGVGVVVPSAADRARRSLAAFLRDYALCCAIGLLVARRMDHARRAARAAPMSARVLLFADFGDGPQLVSNCRDERTARDRMTWKVYGTGETSTSAAFRWYLVECESAAAGRKAIEQYTNWNANAGLPSPLPRQFGPGRILDSGPNRS